MVVEVSLSEALGKAMEKALSLGFEVNKQGSIVLNESMVFHMLSKALEEYGVIYTSIRDALKNYPDLVEKYGFKKISIDMENIDDGVFLYIPPNTRIKDPLYTCFVLAHGGVRQRVYNLTVLEEGSEAVAATGCFSLVNEGYHTSFEEAYIGRGARLYKVMVHNWMPRVSVSTIKRIALAEKAHYYDYYINHTSLERMSFIIELYLEGEGSTARTDTIVVGRGGSKLLYDVKAYLKAEGSSAELISRLLGDEESSIDSRSTIIAEAPGTKGHIECQGLLLSDRAAIRTVPSLESRVSDTSLTHEASIGRISRDELEYLMARGFREDEAVSMIIRGFLELGYEKIPPKLRSTIDIVLNKLSHAEM